MSTDYKPKCEIIFEELFDGRLERFGVRENLVQGTTSTEARCLTDGHNNFLWSYGGQFVELFKRYMPNGNPGNILAAIEEAFNTEIFSEYEPQYWGFETEEEWDAAMRKMHEESQAEFYIEIMKHVRGEPNNMGPTTVGMVKANIAKNLVAENRDLASLEQKAELMEAIEKIYSENHAVIFTLDEKDIATVRLAMTDVEDLPCV